MRVCEDYYHLERAVERVLRDDNMHDNTYCNVSMARMRLIPEMNRRFKQSMREQPSVIFDDGFKVNPLELRNTTEWIGNQFACAFAEKIAMGERYALTGVAPHKNMGYQMGSTLVEIINQMALAHLSNLSGYSEDQPFRYKKLGDARALRYLAPIIKNVLSAAKVMQPMEEDLLEPFILQVRPQPPLMPPAKRNPKDIAAAILDSPLSSAERWAPSRNIWQVELLKGLREDGRPLTEDEKQEKRWAVFDAYLEKLKASPSGPSSARSSI